MTKIVLRVARAHLHTHMNIGLAVACLAGTSLSKPQIGIYRNLCLKNEGWYGEQISKIFVAILLSILNFLTQAHDVLRKYLMKG